MNKQELIQQMTELYQKMYELTRPECGKCRVPLSCCDTMYCGLAAERAEEFGVKLALTDHDRLPYMGENGCTVPPHLRPLCTFHTCDILSWGFKAKDDDDGTWTKTYFDLRHQIEKLEGEWFDLKRKEKRDAK